MTKIQKTFTYRLKPNKTQRILLARFAGCARFVFNFGLSLIKEALDNKQKVPTYVDIANKLPFMKRNPETAWLKEPHSQVLQQSLKDLENARRHFFRRLIKKEKPGFPKFKKKGNKDSFRYPQNIKCKDGKVFLPKIGWVSYHDSRPIEGEIKQATVKREGQHWNIHIVCEIEKEIHKVFILPEDTIGIDLGLLNFAYLSNGQVIENPKFLKKDLQKLRYKQRQFSRKQKGSNNRKKCALNVAKLHSSIKNKRKDFQHKLSTDIAKNHGVVAVEDLNVKGMVRNSHLSRAISDAGWRGFIDNLKYKCEWSGKHFVKVDRFLPSSKRCSACGHEQNIALHTRTYKCVPCGLQIDRDLNASINIRAAGLSVLKACGEISVG